MSRCLAFPTPEFANTESYQTALVELIKLRKEKEKAKRMERKNRKLRRKVPKEFVGCERVEKYELSEQLEKSDITEEHDQQTDHSYSSDSPQSVKKRKQLDNSANGTEFQFRLPSKHRCEDLLQLSTPERTETVIPKKSTTVEREEAIYRRLFEKLVPPSSTPTGFGDETWLFELTNQPQTRKESFGEQPDGCSRFSARARFLPEVDTWALPYTVLF